MKKVLFITLVIIMFYNTNVIGQIVKMRTDSIGYKLQQNDGTWSDWSELKEMSILILLNTEEERVTIFSSEKQVYDLTGGGEIVSNDEGCKWTRFPCVDDRGESCYISFVFCENYRDKVLIELLHTKVVYTCYILK